MRKLSPYIFWHLVVNLVCRTWATATEVRANVSEHLVKEAARRAYDSDFQVFMKKMFTAMPAPGTIKTKMEGPNAGYRPYWYGYNFGKGKEAKQSIGQGSDHEQWDYGLNAALEKTLWGRGKAVAQGKLGAMLLDKLNDKDDVETNCYKYNSMYLSWEDANATCESVGSFLAYTNSAGEAHFLAKNIPYSYYTRSIHIGFKLIGGHWTSVHGVTLDKMGYINWAPGEPNNADGYEYCVSMYQRQTYNDINCKYAKFPFFCERKLSKDVFADAECEPGELKYHPEKKVLDKPVDEWPSDTAGIRKKIGDNEKAFQIRKDLRLRGLAIASSSKEAFVNEY